MRRIFFRVSAGLIAVGFVWALSVGAVNDMPLYKRVLTCGVMLAFFVYSIAGDRAANTVLGLMFSLPSAKRDTTTELDAPDDSVDDSLPTDGN